MNDESLFFNVGDLFQRYHIWTIVVGYPKNEEELQKKIDIFIEQMLFVENTLKVIRADEEYSSVQAWEVTWSFEKWSEEDTVASMVILETYLKENGVLTK